MQARIQGKHLKEVLKIVLPLTNEGVLDFEDDGVDIIAIDESHTAMVRLKLNKSAFKSYDAKREKIPLDLKKLDEFVSLGTGETFDLEYSDDTKFRLQVRFSNLQKRIAPIDGTAITKPPKTPEIKANAKILLSRHHLLLGLKASKAIDEEVTLISTDELFETIADAGIEDVTMDFKPDELDEYNLAEESKATYSQVLMGKMVSGPSCDKVGLEYATNMPLKLTFTVADGEGEGHYLLAPIVMGDGAPAEEEKKEGEEES